MKTKNKLSKIAYEILIERKLYSFTLIEVRDLLSTKYKDEFNEEELYKHLHRQMNKLCEVGYLVRDLEKKSLYFRVTNKFLNSTFELAKTTKLFETGRDDIENVLAYTEEHQEVQISTIDVPKQTKHTQKNQQIKDKIDVSIHIPKSFFKTQEQNQEVIFSVKLSDVKELKPH